MPRKNPLTDEQKKFIDENYESMTCLDMSIALDLKSIFKVSEYFHQKGYQRKKELTKDQKQFVRDNYLRMKESEIMRKLGITRALIQKFKREEGLFTYPANRKEKKVSGVKEMFFDVDAIESWVA